MLPIACFSCNKRIGKYEREFVERVENGENKEEILNSLKIVRYCCRRMFLGYENVVDKLILYSESDDKSYKRKSETEK